MRLESLKGKGSFKYSSIGVILGEDMARILMKQRFDREVTEKDIERILRKMGCKPLASGFVTGYGGYVIAECVTPTGEKVIKHFMPTVITRKIEQELILYELSKEEVEKLKEYAP